MEQQYTLIDALRILLKWKWHITAMTIFAAIGSMIYTWFFMPDWFESSAVFYPTNQYITDRANLFNKETSGDSEMSYFGTKRDVNRVLSIAESGGLIGFMMSHYQLHRDEGYDIDTTIPHWRYLTRKKFLKNFSAIKTEKEAIEIKIAHTDKYKAAEMVNMMVVKVDEINKDFVLKNKFKIKNMFESKLKEKETELATLIDSVAEMKTTYKIDEKPLPNGDFEYSGKNTLKVLQYKALRDKQRNVATSLDELRILFDQNETATRQNPASIYIVEEAYPADRKERPKRSIICASVTMITFVLAMLAALFIEQWKVIQLELSKEH